jgi:DNA-binding beta-propeller fold protein YncE
MPLSTTRITRLALIVCGLALMSAFSGCASFSDTPPAGATSSPEPAQLTPSNPWLYPLETITGGFMGNAIVGNELHRLQRPVAVAVRDHDLYIVDADQEMLFLYDTITRRMSVLKDLRGLATAGPKPFMSVHPGVSVQNEVQGGRAIDVTDVYVSGDHSYYIADAFGRRVLHFDRDGQLLQTFQDPLNLGRPVAINVDETTGDVYVADGLFDHILVFNSVGDLWRMLGDRGMTEGTFLNITAMTRGVEGVYVTARLGVRGQVLNQDNGQFIYAFQKDTLAFPNGIAVDMDGRAYVSDFLDNTIKIFEHGRLVATAGGTGASPGRFKGISDVTLGNGFLYVADSLNGRIQVFRTTTGSPPAGNSQ